MKRSEIFEKINEMNTILYGIFDEDLFDYCLECLNYDEYASEEGFYRKVKGEEEC